MTIATGPRVSHAVVPLAWEAPVFDRALIRKYDVPGPRYTSYPPAPSFVEDPGGAAHAERLRASAVTGGPLSLYLHVPFCQTRCFFCGCNVVISRNQGRASVYLDALDAEMRTVAALVGADDREVKSIHWGGGSPNFLPPAGISRLAAMIRRRFPGAAKAEFSVEIDPRRLEEAHLDAFAAAGVRRASLGVQDVDPQVQEAVNRVQPFEETRAVVEGLRRRGITSVNVDLIYGLPHQTVDGFAATLERVLELEPDRLAVFNFAYLPSRLPHQRAIDADALPAPDTKLTILERVIARLTDAGYLFIGMDHFARPDDPLAVAFQEGTMVRNFQGYDTVGGSELVGLGSSSISQIGGGFAQNLRDVGPYQEAVSQGRLATDRGYALTDEDLLRADVVFDLLCRLRIDKATIEARHGIDFDRHFADALRRLEDAAGDGLVDLGRDVIRVTAAGRLLVRPLAMAFDAHLAASPREFSRTV